MKNSEIIEIVKGGSVVLNDSLDGLNNDSHNRIANAIDDALWQIAQRMGYDGVYDDFINDMIPKFREFGY